MKDGVVMMDNKTMLCNHSKCTPLTKTYTCKDGCKVSPDGTVTKPDGSTMKLMNGICDRQKWQSSNDPS